MTGHWAPGERAGFWSRPAPRAQGAASGAERGEAQRETQREAFGWAEELQRSSLG